MLIKSSRRLVKSGLDKETLIEKINTKLNNLDEKNLRFVYKIINEI